MVVVAMAMMAMAMATRIAGPRRSRSAPVPVALADSTAARRPVGRLTHHHLADRSPRGGTVCRSRSRVLWSL